MSVDELRKCPGCEGQVPAASEKCPRCNYPRYAFIPCVICKMPVPAKAERCNKCNAYQGAFRRHFVVSSTVLALLTALLSVLSTVLPRVVAYANRNSNTVVTFLSGNEQAIYIRVRNTGLSPATLRGYRLRFGDLPVAGERLALVRSGAPETRDYVPKEGEATIGLTAPALHSRISHAELEKQIATQQVTLEVEVQESDGPRSGPWPVRIATLPADAIREFILAKVPDEEVRP